jgi:hypothetical protein
VQQPQIAIPQPYFVPVRPRSSRSTQSSGFSGSTSTVIDLPFTLKAIAFINIALVWTRAALVDPVPDCTNELCMRERWCASSFAGIPSPQHERIVIDVID